MATLTLGIDIDGTQTDTWGTLLRLAERRYGIIAAKKDMRRHELRENEPFKRITQQQATELFSDVWKNYKTIPLEHARIPEIINTIKKAYSPVYTVTSTIADNMTICNYYSHRGIKIEGGIFWFGEPEKKVNSGVDVIVDDHYKVVEAFANSGKTAVLLAQPWNEEFRKSNGSNKNIKIAHNWTEIPEILFRIHEEKTSSNISKEQV